MRTAFKCSPMPPHTTPAPQPRIIHISSGDRPAIMSPCTALDVANASETAASPARRRRSDSNSHKSSGNDAARDALCRGMSRRDVASMTAVGIASAAHTATSTVVCGPRLMTAPLP
jgi:hypothetical protein